jgi:hypothetical protein
MTRSPTDQPRTSAPTFSIVAHASKPGTMGHPTYSRALE